MFCDSCPWQVQVVEIREGGGRDRGAVDCMYTCLFRGKNLRVFEVEQVGKNSGLGVRGVTELLCPAWERKKYTDRAV